MTGKMTVDEAAKEYAEMKRLGMLHGAEALRDRFRFWHSVDIAKLAPFDGRKARGETK